MAWWLAGGIDNDDVVAVYQPYGAPSYSASLQNLAHDDHDIVSGSAGWSSSGGWQFNGTSHYFVTDITPSSNYTVIVRYVNVTKNNSVLIGEFAQSGGADFYVQVRGNNGAANRWGYGNGFYTSSIVTSGAMALAGGDAYQDTTLKQSNIGSWSGTPRVFWIGELNGFTNNKCNGSIRAIAIYSRKLSSSEVQAVVAAMNNLSSSDFGSIIANGASSSSGTASASLESRGQMSASGASQSAGSALIAISPHRASAVASSASGGTGIARLEMLLSANASSISAGAGLLGLIRPIIAAGSSTSTGAAAMILILPLSSAGASQSSGTVVALLLLKATANGTSASTGVAIAAIEIYLATAGGTSVVYGDANILLQGRLSAAGSAISVASANLILRLPISAAGASVSAGQALGTLELKIVATGTSQSAGTASTGLILRGLAAGSSISVGRSSALLELVASASGSSVSAGQADMAGIDTISASGTSVSQGQASGSLQLLVQTSGASSSLGHAAILIPQLVAEASGASTSAGIAFAVRLMPLAATGSSVSSGNAMGLLTLAATGRGSSQSAGQALALLDTLASAAGTSTSHGNANPGGVAYVEASGASTSAGTAAIATVIHVSAAGLSLSSGSASARLFHTTASGASQSAGDAYGRVDWLARAVGMLQTSGTARALIDALHITQLLLLVEARVVAAPPAITFWEFHVHDRFGNWLAYLDGAMDKSYQAALNEPGGGSFRIHLNDHSYRHIAHHNVVVVRYGRQRVGAFVIENIDEELIAGSRSEEVARVSGRGLLGLLEHVIVWPEIPGSGETERSFSATATAIMHRLLEEAESRGAHHLAAAFSPQYDSRGILATQVLTRKYGVGQTLLEVVRNHVASGVEVTTDADRRLYYWIQGAGTDKTREISFREGKNLLRFRRSRAASELRNAVLVKGEGKDVVKTNGASIVAYGRLEAGQDSRSADTTYLNLVGTRFLAEHATPHDTMQAVVAADPRPFLEYGLGDVVAVISPTRGIRAEYRVYEITVTERGGPTALEVQLTLGKPIPDYLIRLSRTLEAYTAPVYVGASGLR
jgi:hypothetical protein